MRIGFLIAENDMSVDSQSSLGWVTSLKLDFYSEFYSYLRNKFFHSCRLIFGEKYFLISRISNQDENSIPDRAYGSDPLDGLDDFRALLEAAESDENYQNPRGPSSQLQQSLSSSHTQALSTQPSSTQQYHSQPSPKKASSKDKEKEKEKDEAIVPAKVRKRAATLIRVAPAPNKIKYPVPERRRPKPKDPEPVRFTDDSIVPGLSHEVGLGVVPKYRAKNRLRSIIKRKPGTQDTDLMSNNVEILGGRVDKQTVRKVILHQVT